MGVATVITSIGGLLIAGAGAYLQYEQDQELMRESKRRFEKEAGMEESQFGRSVALKAQELRDKRAELEFAKSEAQKTWSWKEQDRNWQRAREFADRLTSLVQQTPSLQDRLVNIWRQKGAI